MVAELTFAFVIFTLVTFAITAGILHSELVSGLREKWISYFHNSKLKYLGICSLCLGFHVGNIIQWLYMPFMGLVFYFGFSLAAAVITWGLSAFVTNMLWQRAYYEQEFRRNE